MGVLWWGGGGRGRSKEVAPAWAAAMERRRRRGKNGEVQEKASATCSRDEHGSCKTRAEDEQEDVQCTGREKVEVSTSVQDYFGNHTRYVEKAF